MLIKILKLEFRLIFNFRMDVTPSVRPIVPKAGLEGADFAKKYGQLGVVLNQTGYGWLLQQDDMAKSDVPLMTELDIDLNEIWYKVRCVLLPLPQVI